MRLLSLAALIAALALPAAAQTIGRLPARSYATVPADLGALPDSSLFTTATATTLAGVPAGSIPLTVDAATEIALERGYAIRLAELDVATARAQVRQQYGTL